MAAGLFRVAPNHIICAVPANLGLVALSHVQVVKGEEASTVFSVGATASSGALLTDGFPDRGPGAGIVRNEDGTLNDKDHPATGNATVTVFAAGLGNPVADGRQIELRLNPVGGPLRYPPPFLWISGRIRTMRGFIANLAAIDIVVPTWASTQGQFVVALGGSSAVVYVK